MELIHFIHLNAELNPIRHLIALVGARHIVHVSRIRVKKTAQLSPSVERERERERESKLTYGPGQSSIYRMRSGDWSLILRR